MIEHYELRKVNNEKVLILYLSYDYEFSSDLKHKNILMNINNFIKNKKIKWNGNKVIIVVGGLILGTLVLGKINIPEVKNKKQFNYVSNIILNHYDDFNNEVGYSKIEIKEPIVVIEEEKETTKPSTISNQKEKEDIKADTSTKEIDKKEEIKNEVTETMVTVYRSNGTILNIELEEYIVGVVAIEMPAAFNMEALKAQSVAARTYALKCIEKNIKLTDNEKTQSYRDIQQLKELWGNNLDIYYNKVKKAVLATKGEVLTYNNEYIEALYHSTSNGYTEDSYEVFGNSYPYLVTVDSIWDINASSYSRDKEFSFPELNNILGIDFGNNPIIEIIERTNSGRISRIRINDNYYTGIELRNLLGLRSADFDININNDKVIVTTRGYGHGVGMSQYGANGMANSGKNYKDILTHYYKGTTIKTV